MSAGPFGPVLAPVPGNGPGIHAVADALAATGQRLAAACRDLGRLRDGAVWDGPAGDAFASRIRTVPTVLDRAARRHLCAAPPLHRFADVLEEEQAVAQRCVDEHAESTHAWVALEDRAAALAGLGRGEEDPEVAVLRELQREQTAAARSAEAGHRAALDRLEAADAVCAAALRELCDDELADPFVYRALRATSATGHTVGAVAGMGSRWSPPLLLVGVAGDGTATTADAALLVGYDEGSWTDVGVSAATTALSTGGDVLRAGAKAGAVVRADGTVVAVARLSTQERIVVGAAQTARARVRDARELLDLTADRRTASALVGGAVRESRRPTAAGLLRAGTRALRGKVEAARTELALVRAGGPGSTRMYVAGISLTASAKVVEQVDERRTAHQDAGSPAQGPGSRAGPS